MKEIVIISGKGGTGKTSITAALAMIGSTEVVVADCDVDAADMHLLLEPDYDEEEEFFGGEKARIKQDLCIQCGRCESVCHFDAIDVRKGRFYVHEMHCEGCGYCARICPTHAIINEKARAGMCYTSHIKTGSMMVHARLDTGADNSGKLVAKVKNDAKDLARIFKKPYILVDGSPGIGCPVVSSLTGARLVVLVTEPSVSGFHDLKRVYELVKKFNIPTACIINKADLNGEKTREIEHFLTTEHITLLAKLPYDPVFTRSMTLGKTLVEYDPGSPLTELLRNSWNTIKSLINPSI